VADGACAPGIFPLLTDPAIVVGFAGGGGSSLAVEAALDRHPDAALNHWPLALAVHERNFPGAEHHCADIHDTDCRSVCPGRRIGLLWLSPDCRHFSKAKGGAPVSARVRGLAWVAIPWAKVRRPDVIMLENVEEFLTWGPLGADGKPDPARKGHTFERWLRRLRQCGYQVEWRILSAADYGAPTIRKRLFIVARCDGKAIVWPAPTHAPRAKAKARGLPPYRAAAEIIDWSRPCPSIFLPPDEARKLRIKRPLEEATLRRIAKGLYRYTIAHADPFIVPVTHRGDDRAHDLNEPLRTITTADRGEFALIAPHLTKFRTGSDGADLREPAPTITANSYVKRPGGAPPLGLASAFLVPHFGEAPGQEPRSRDIADPYPTVTAAGTGGDLASVFLTKFSENSIGHLPDEPLHTVMAGAPRHRLVTAHLQRQFGASVGSDLGEPMGAVMPGGGGKTQILAAFMEQANTDMVGHDAREPVSTVVGKGCTQRLIAAQLTQLRGSNEGRGDIGDPLPGLTAGGSHQAVLQAVLDADQPMAVPFSRHEAELRAFLVKYYGEATAQDLADPLGTVTARSRFGLVLVAGQAWRIADIGMRMLDPETELAAAMGVRRSYVLGFDAAGERVTKTAITKMVGNMVSPPPAEALIAANCADLWPQAVAA
jgi:DNA (cytosine-5)-methyltransferase 1